MIVNHELPVPSPLSTFKLLYKIGEEVKDSLLQFYNV